AAPRRASTRRIQKTPRRRSLMTDAATRREFFAVKTVAETLARFRPARRTVVEAVALDAAAGRVPAAPVRAPHDLPGFARSTVDGYAVRAADTFGASEGLPTYLEVAGAIAMGTAPDVAVAPGGAVAIPTGGVLRPARTRWSWSSTRRRRCRGRSRWCGPPRRATAWCAPTRTPPRAPSSCPPVVRCARRTSACSPRPA